MITKINSKVIKEMIIENNLNNDSTEKKPLVIIAGPTAAGKSDLAIRLAKEINGEIISADSMQVYKKMDIGSAKVTVEEMQGIKHYGIDVLEPTEDFNVTFFQSMAKSAIEQIYKQNKIPIIAGGTGFYIQSVLYDINFEENEQKDGYRQELEALALQENGAHTLYEMLRSIDPKSIEIIHENNVKRVIRALEYYHETGEPISAHNEREKQKESPYAYSYFVITDERSQLYARIDKRVDKMVQNGLVDEVKALKALGLTRANVSMQGIGYKEILDYLDGIISLEEAIYIIKRDTRHFAKRQLTWFRREREISFIDRSELGSDQEMLQAMIEELKQKNII